MRWILLLALVVACSSKDGASGGPPKNTATPTPTPSPTPTTPQTPEERVRARVAEIHQACADDKVDAVIGMIAYRGDDEARRWKSAMRSDDPKARGAAIELCQHIKGPAPKVTKFESETESEGTWLVATVELVDGTAAFAFLDVGGVLLLGDID